jgi:hypothetical protein
MNRRTEDGSMPLTLLAAIIIAGVVVALFITVDTGVDTARRDRDWHSAINVADAGLQEAIAVIRDSDIDIACPGGTCTGELGEAGTYRATYTETTDGLLVCSEGTVAEVVREACTELDLNLLVGGAGIIGLDRVRIDGSLSGTTLPLIIGTGGDFVGVGSACGKIEEVEIYYPSEEDNPCPGKPITRTSRTFTNIAEFEFTEGVCSEAQAAVIWDSYPTVRPSSEPQPWVYGETYCTRLIDIPKDTINLVGNPNDGPVRVFADPGSTGAAAAKYAGNGSLNATGEAIDLQFYIRRGVVDLDMKGTTTINAVWYAPDSSCDVRGNATFTGAIVCKRSDVGGSLQFIVPDDIRTLRAGPTVVTRWFEQ